ncbi:carboxymuconolactone decarboxylase family protein [Mumia sp. DW29H23]|uniref:carboxymuconolactone decarboxylase family protein n=1 Tax=Mumia sp. DW29H23 TaxID=3421241 RepID=UPI003D683AC2
MFLDEPPYDDQVRALYDADRESDGYVNNLTRVWAWRPDVEQAATQARATVARDSALTDADRAVLVAATAAARGDSYCSLAWGRRLASLTDPATAAGVLSGDTDGLDPRTRALAAWASVVVRDPNATSGDDVAGLRAVGLGDREIFEATAFVALRLAFSTVNDALGARPDRQLADGVPAEVAAVVTYGRQAADEPSA